MRKSLLITSALGLVSALPTFAMANAAAAGSSSAACASGFFAQIDAKIMNAKLEIKNEKGKSTVPADEETNADKLVDAAVADVISQLKNASFEVLFDYGTEANKGTFLEELLVRTNLADLRGKSPADVAKEISRAINAGRPVVTDAEKKAALRQAGTEVVDGALADADAAKIFDRVVADVTTLANSVDPVVKTGTLNDALLRTYTFAPREPGQAAAVVADALVVNMDNGYYRPNMGGKIYVANAGGAGEVNAAYLTDLRTAVNTRLDLPGTLTDLKAAQSILEFAKTAVEKNVKLNEQYKALKAYDVTDRRVHHHALAGGVGATAGWWQNMGGFAVSISGTGDYLWGTFRTMDDASGSSMQAQDKRKLGFGFQGDLGLHYVVSPSTTLGVLVGFRGQQLNIGRTDKTATTTSKDSKGDYASKWMWNPVVSAQARTFFTDTVYGALTVGYVIPMSERDFKLENTNIANKDAKVRFQGLTGAFSVGMMF